MQNELYVHLQGHATYICALIHVPDFNSVKNLWMGFQSLFIVTLSHAFVLHVLFFCVLSEAFPVHLL